MRHILVSNGIKTRLLEIDKDMNEGDGAALTLVINYLNETNKKRILNLEESGDACRELSDLLGMKVRTIPFLNFC